MRRHPGRHPLLVMLCLCAWAPSLALAQSAASAPSRTDGGMRPAPSLLVSEHRWSDLSSAQRAALAPLQSEWSAIDPSRRQKWVEIADRFPSMTADERARVQTRMGQWARLSPKERGEARVNFQELRQLTPAEKQARWERYQTLTVEQKAELARRAAPAPDRSSGQAGSARPADASQKSNIVSATTPRAAPAKPVAPTVVQAGPGATTNLITQKPNPPMHQQPGLPKVTATPGFVDKTTLLPRRGAQAAGVREAASAPAAPSSR